MSASASENPDLKAKLDTKLLVGTLLFCLFNKPVLALADDAQELAAIKAQMRILAAQVEAIEHRQAKRSGVSKTRTTTLQGRGKRTATALVDGPADPAIRFSPDAQPATVAQASDLPLRAHGNSTNPLGFEWLPGSQQEVVGHGHSALDLSSSSPASITQTSVDHLPPVFSIGGISVKLGGFVELSNIARDSNMTAGPATAWGNFPYANNPNHGLSEERISAQLSRMSVLMEANPRKDIRLQAYVETDFGGAAGTSNSVQISGYTPRMRQGYFTFTQKDWGFHLLMGQAWSLVTNYSKGLLPRQEQLPAVTDNNQIPGIAFTRVPQIRIGKDWNEKYWLGLSIEDPQGTVGSNLSTKCGFGSTGVSVPTAGGNTCSYYQNSGGVLLNSGTSYTDNPAPDIVLKAAADTSFGHYEVFGLGRWFRSLTVAPGESTSRKHTHFGGGVGAGLTTPLGTKKLQLAGNILAGEGVGRYGPSLLPDTTLNSRGQLTPVPEIIGSLGLIGHPSKSVLLYTYGGVETAGRKSYLGNDGKQYGYGVSDQNLSGCSVEFGVCNAQTHTLASFTTGGWWHFMDGHYGSVMAGLQYTYIRKLAFKGNDGMGNSVSPTTFGNTVYVTFRYLPFQ